MLHIEWLNLLWCLLPLSVLVALYIKWLPNVNDLLLGLSRMVLQLIAMGYVLIWIFAHPNVWITLGMLVSMALVSAFIAVRPFKHFVQLNIRHITIHCVFVLIVMVVAHLIVTLFLVLNITNQDTLWFAPNVLLPLAGMYYASSMNSISLSCERYFSEIQNGKSVKEAQYVGFNAAMMVQINSLLAVGLVALPGMMTGQILAGAPVIEAVKYQILIMAMLVSVSGLSSASILSLLKRI